MEIQTKPYGIIYLVTNIVNNKSYIGQTVKPLKNRINGHKERMISGSNIRFYNALRKYGFENFTWEILCECNNRNELDEKEIFYIDILKTSSKQGYNLTKGGSWAGKGNPMDILENVEKVRQSKIGGLNPNTPWWYIIEFADGRKIEGPSMRQICRENNIERFRKTLCDIYYRPGYGTYSNRKMSHPEFIGCTVKKVLRTDR